MSAISSFSEDIASGIFRNAADDGDIHWVISEDSVLTISGSGAIPDKANISQRPWYSFKASVKKCVIEEGITRLGEYSLSGFQNIEKFYMANSVTSMGKSAMSYALMSLPIKDLKLSDNLEIIETQAIRFYTVTEMILPQSVNSIGSKGFMFHNLAKLHVQWDIPLSENLASDALDNTTPKEILYVPAGTEELYETAAVWGDFNIITAEPDYYTVSFDSQGGSAVAAIEHVESGTTIDAPENPAKEDLIFDGWYTGPDYATAWDFETSTVVSDTTLYAKWTTVRTGTVQDYDGNWYNTVVYGNLEWMVENLRVTHFNDGTEIRKGEYTNAPGSAEDFAVYYMYPDNNVANVEDYGLLYTWNVAFDHEGNPPTNPTPNSHGFGPEGWRVPTRTEWATLGTTDWDGSVAAFLTVTGIPESFNPQFAGDFNTGGYANFDSRTEYWLPELVMPGQGYGCRWMHIDATAPTTVVQNQNRNNNCKSIRLVRDADNPQTAIVATDAAKTALRIYPNAAGEYTVSGINRTATLTLYNLAGRVVFIQAVENGGSISLGKLAKGIYIAKASSETIKLIKK